MRDQTDLLKDPAFSKKKKKRPVVRLLRCCDLNNKQLEAMEAVSPSEQATQIHTIISETPRIPVRRTGDADRLILHAAASQRLHFTAAQRPEGWMSIREPVCSVKLKHWRMRIFCSTLWAPGFTHTGPSDLHH